MSNVLVYGDEVGSFDVIVKEIGNTSYGLYFLVFGVEVLVPKYVLKSELLPQVGKVQQAKMPLWFLRKYHLLPVR